MNDSSRNLFGGWLSAAAYAGVLLALVAAIYWPIFQFSYVQDDLRIVNFIRTHGTGEALSRIFSPHERLFYRPLSSCYYLMIIKTFDLDAAGYHAGAMILLALGAWMSAQVIHAITGNRLIAAGTGLLYAAAPAIHIDTLMWMVGMNELGAMLFMLASMALHLRGRTGQGAAAFAIALLFKEAVLFLPILLFIHLLARNGWKNIIRESVARLWPYALVLAVCMIPKYFATPLTAMPDTHPYAMRFAGFHVLGNALTYSKWYFEAIFPMFAESSWKEQALAVALRHCTFFAVGIAALAVAAAAWLARNARRAGARPAPADIWILLAWIPLGLLPTVFLPNHCFRYYLTYSLPPVLALFLIGLGRAADALSRRKLPAAAVLSSWIVICVVFSFGYFHRRAAEGLLQRFADGSNGLICKATHVNIVRKQLPRLRPDIPAGSVLVFVDVDISGINGRHGVQLWFGDPTLQVFDARRVARDRKGWFAEVTNSDAPWVFEPDQPKIRTDLDPAKTFVFRQSGGILTDITAEFLASHELQDDGN